MTAALKQLIDRNLEAVSAKDLDKAVAAFAVDGALIDPHYPIDRMQGHEQIAEGFRWVFAGMQQLGFTVERYFFADDGLTVSVEVLSNHVLKNGRPLEFRQVFVVETCDGLITRWQAYEPYGPHGVGGFFLGLGKRATGCVTAPPPEPVRAILQRHGAGVAHHSTVMGAE
ncbi:nuclear transport factor 2 family protein [Leifsonia sp. Root112D2]|uniref:nuclear transport factor 2 family protein n=1 Tax=Leifsonia sp. Root112D2 TaxID=1736426 RepID=UPI0006F4154E|nr:nuclear transport factor 2 family protein [Leifsonia sp. Root112D2]KQV07013.1 hypothetical protein ASC63_06635 [Leifsonia sp. Root112D2]